MTTLAMIRSFVASAWVGLKPENVTIAKFETEQPAAAASPASARLPRPEQPQAWLRQNWPALAICGVVLVGCVVLSSRFRSVARPSAVPATTIAPPNMQLLGDEGAVTAEPVIVAPPGLHGPSATLRRELHVMVRERPQTAAGVLRNWLSNAS